MATYYVDSAATGTADGLTWTNAKTTIAAALTVAVGGDTVWVKNGYAESSAAAITLTGTSSTNLPVNLFVAGDLNMPPTSIGAASITTSSNFILTGKLLTKGLSAYQTAASNFGVTIYGNNIILDGCNLYKNGTVQNLALGSNTASTSYKIKLSNCNLYVRNSTAGSGIRFLKGEISIYGGSVNQYAAGAISAANGLFICNTDPQQVELIDVDFSTILSSYNTIPLLHAPQGTGTIKFINCNKGVNWSGVLCKTRPSQPGLRVSLFNSFQYSYSAQTYYGKIMSDTGVYLVGGATEGITPTSWAFTPESSDLSTFGGVLDSEVITIPVTSVGTKTVNVEISSNYTLDNSDIFVNVVTPDAVFTNRVDFLATPVAHSSSPRTWVGGGTTNQVMQLTFSVASAGNVYITICLAKNYSLGVFERVNVDYAAYLT